MRARILARDRYVCHWCHGPAREVDHLVPRALGGSDYDPANLVAACRACNAKRAARLRKELGLAPPPWHRVSRAPYRERVRAGAIRGRADG
jgi:5-methylcytosine-specific restriction endonuclease McrA